MLLVFVICAGLLLIVALAALTPPHPRAPHTDRDHDLRRRRP
jgi:hypothetical protein